MSLKDILGHTDLKVTQVYMHLAGVHVQMQHAKYSLADRIGVSSQIGQSSLASRRSTG